MPLALNVAEQRPAKSYFELEQQAQTPYGAIGHLL